MVTKQKNIYVSTCEYFQDPQLVPSTTCWLLTSPNQQSLIVSIRSADSRLNLQCFIQLILINLDLSRPLVMHIRHHTPDDHRSINLRILCLTSSNLISNWSKKQPNVACSSTSAEYRRLGSPLLLKTSRFKYRSLLSALLIYCDNLGTVPLSHNPVLHSHNKHMERLCVNRFLARVSLWLVYSWTL